MGCASWTSTAAPQGMSRWVALRELRRNEAVGHDDALAGPGGSRAHDRFPLLETGSEEYLLQGATEDCHCGHALPQCGSGDSRRGSGWRATLRLYLLVLVSQTDPQRLPLGGAGGPQIDECRAATLHLGEATCFGRRQSGLSSLETCEGVEVALVGAREGVKVLLGGLDLGVAISGEDPPEVRVVLKGRDEPVQPERDVAGADLDPACRREGRRTTAAHLR